MGIHFFLFSLQNIDCGYSAMRFYRVTTINVLNKNIKHIKFVRMEFPCFFFFFVVVVVQLKKSPYIALAGVFS